MFGTKKLGRKIDREGVGWGGSLVWRLFVRLGFLILVVFFRIFCVDF